MKMMTLSRQRCKESFFFKTSEDNLSVRRDIDDDAKDVTDNTCHWALTVFSLFQQLMPWTFVLH